MASKNTTLTATFELIDEMSDKLANIASNGSSAASSFDDISDAAEGAESAATTSAKSTAQSVDEMGDSFENSGQKAQSSGDKMTSAIDTVATALSAAGIVKMISEVTGALLECSDVAAEFETAMLKVSTVADTSEVPLDELTAGIKSLSMETGRSTTELSDALYQALSASVDTADAIEFTGTAVKLAAGGFTETATAVDVLTTILNAYGLEASKANDISDMLITTQNLGKTTVDELASNMGRVIPTAAAYGVEMDNIGAAYAELTKNGISTRISTTYLNAMLSELGDSGSDVAKILVEETGMSLSQLMDAGYSLGDVLDVIGDSVDGDTAAFNELWSSSSAGMAALTLFNSGADAFNETLAAMDDSAGATTTAFETMTDSTQHAKEELSNAATNLQESIGSAINPLVETLYSLGTSVLNTFTKFADEHPVFVKALSAVAIGIGAVVTVFTAVSVVIPLVTKAVTLLGNAFKDALGPVGAVVTAVTAVVAAGAAFVAMINEDTAEYNTWTAATKTQYDALQDLTRQYEELSESGTATQEELDRLRYQIDDATEAFNNGKQTIEQYTAGIDDLCDSINTLYGDYQSQISAIDENRKGADALIQKYADLASNIDNLSDSEKMQLDAVEKSLIKSYPQLADSIDKTTMSTDEYVDAMRKAVEQETQQEKFEQSQDAYVEALQKRAELEEQIEQTEQMLSNEQERMDNMSWWEHLWTKNEWDGVDAYTESLDKLNAAQAENDVLIASIEGDWEDIAEAERKTADVAMTAEEAISIAFESISDGLEDLCQRYDDAYQAACESFEGQFGLFDMAEADMESTVEAAQAALDSQLAYWTQYGENIERLKAISAEDLGITQESYDNLMAQVQDGSEEAAGLAASMVSALDEGNIEAITNLANTMEEVTSKQEEIARSTADWQTDFTAQMQGYADDMADIIDSLNLSEEAAADAKATTDAYIQQILDSKQGAMAAAVEVADAVSAALSSVSGNVNITYTTAGVTNAEATGTTNAPNAFIAGERGTELVVPAHASGATQAEPYYLAGEHGPELILGQQGSEVFPAGETDKIINSLNQRDNNSSALPYQLNRMIEALSEQLAGMNPVINCEPQVMTQRDSDAFPEGDVNRIVEAINDSRDDNVAVPASDINRIVDAVSGQDSSLIFPASETNRLIDALGSQRDSDAFPEGDVNRIVEALKGAPQPRSGGETLKHIVLEIAGSGSIEVNGAADLDAVLELLQDNLKPVLLNILQQEVLEEGDLSYEY